MRILFAGTPEVAVASLAALLDSDHEVVAVLTRPDAPVGRGRAVQPSPVAQLAAESGVETLKFARPREEAFQRRLEEIAPDACAIVAYGGLIPPQALAVPPHGWVNLHFSLLPAWRGAAPVQHAIWHGDDVTGACTFLLEEGLDTGPVYGVVTEAVRPTDTSGDLLQRLSAVGSGLLVATIDGIADGSLRAVPQPPDGATFAPKITVEDARVDFSQPAIRVDRQIRACTPAPGAWTTLDGERVGLSPVRPDGPGAVQVLGASTESAAPGTVLPSKRAVWVATATEPVLLGEVKPGGKRAMPAADWLRGLRGTDGLRFR